MSLIQPGQRSAGSYCGQCIEGWLYGDWHGLKECPCRARGAITRQLDRIPLEYRGLDLNKIRAEQKRSPHQAFVWRTVRKKPGGCYLICGPSGSGKSAVIWTLYRWAVMCGRPAIAISLADLIEDYRRATIAPYEDQYVPILPLSNLQNEEPRWFIGLDDFHIVRPTPFAGEAAHRLVNAIYSNQHQLVVTSRYDRHNLERHWNGAGGGRGIEIMRRILEIRGADYLPMF